MENMTRFMKNFSGENDTNASSDSRCNTGIIGTFKFIFLQDNRWKYYLNGLQVTLLVSQSCQYFWEL